MSETTRIATVEITYIMNEDDLKKRNISVKSKEDLKRDLERFFAMAAWNENIIAKVTNIQDFVVDNDEPGQNESGWIPCSKMMPKIAGYPVLATLENKFGQRRVARIFTGYGLKPLWYCNNPEFDLNVWKVVAWMPLPEVYKAEWEGYKVD